MVVLRVSINPASERNGNCPARCCRNARRKSDGRSPAPLRPEPFATIEVDRGARQIVGTGGWML